MTLKLHTLDELLRAGKQVIAGGIDQIGTETGTDHDLTIHAAARLLFGAQASAAYLYAQLDPQTADAARRDVWAELLGLALARPASPARGLMAILADMSAPLRVPAGTEIALPGAAFHDGVARTYRTLEDIDSPGSLGEVALGLLPGSGVFKLRPGSPAGAQAFRARDLVQVKADGGTSTWLVPVASANPSDQSLDLEASVTGAVRGSASETVKRYATGVVVPVECTTPGQAGNVAPARAEVELAGLSPNPAALLLGAGGGGDAVGEADAQPGRTVRMLEDTLACPPGFGNDQHLRELALSCPDVVLDDVLVFRHVRGVGTVDLVCIGPSGSVRAPAYPDVNLAYVAWGNNTRRIGEVQAAKVEAFCRARASYHDDIKVHSVRWDYRGNTYAESVETHFLQAANRVDLNITPALGYGPDAGVVLDITPHTRDASKLYPIRSSVPIAPALQPGHRIWATVGHSTTAGRHPFATLVTEVLSVAPDRSYATIAPVSGLLPASYATAVAGTDAIDLRVLRWGTAGPVTQPVIDAVFAYFDGLGPGSYEIAPKAPGYVQRFWGADLASPMSGRALTRWPPEGRRWSSGLRASELRASILEVDGVDSVQIGRLADGLVDCDPAPLRTLALTGVLPRFS